eukprot:1731274-Karenia_brevis.AAC.1
MQPAAILHASRNCVFDIGRESKDGINSVHAGNELNFTSIMSGSVPEQTYFPAAAGLLQAFCNFRLCTWNSAALFGSVHGNHNIQRRRYEQYLRLSKDNDINCIQEAHGSSEDLNALRNDLKDHLHFGSFCDNQNAGGVVTTIGPQL